MHLYTVQTSASDKLNMNGNIAILLCFFSISSLFTAEGYIVDGDNGNDNNDGETINDPFKTITRCVEALANPGDECLIRAGNYHEVVTLTGLQGKTQIARWHTYPKSAFTFRNTG